VLDRPIRFVVTRGARGTVRGDTLHEVQELLARPWSSDEEPREKRRGGGRDDRGGRGGKGRPPYDPRRGKRRR
jgi:ATP-dependent helicase HrpA